MQTRVLYVHHRAQMSGAARSLASLLSHLDPEWEPHVLTPPGPAARAFERAGARVTTAPASLFQHTWDNPYARVKWLLLARELAAAPGHLVALRRLLQEIRPALVHLNDSPLLPAGVVARAHGVPVVWHLRSALADRGRIRSAVVRGLIERTGRAAIAIDDDVRRSFRLALPTRVIFNSVDLDVDVPVREVARARLGLPDDAMVVGFVGNLRHVKGWPQLVEALGLLRSETVHLVVLGSGVRPPQFFRSPYGRAVAAAGLATDEETEMRDLVRARGLERHTTFLPFTDRVGDVYAALDVVAFPNQGTGIGRPVLEAAAYGVPSIAAGSPNGGGALLPEKTGVLLAAPTPPAIADALRRLAADPALRTTLGAAARAHARERFDPVRNARRVEDVYRAAIRADGSRR